MSKTEPSESGIDIDRADIGLRGEAVGDDPAIRHARNHRLDLGMIDAERCKAIERYVLDKAVERRLHAVEGAEMVEMLRIDIGDDRDRGGELDEGPVAFVRLDHHPIARAEARVGAIGVDDTAIDHRRVVARAFENGGDEGGGGRLAMSAGDRDRPFQPHQLAQHLGPADDR